MADIALLESDPKAEDAGVWTTLTHGLDAEFLILGTGSHEFRWAKYRIAREVRLEGFTGPAAEVECEIRSAAFLLRGWRKLTAGGSEHPYSPENALDLMRRAPALCGDVAEYASLRFHFRTAYSLAADPDAEGNSETSLPGEPAGKDEMSTGSATA